MNETRTVLDPFLGKPVDISNRLIDRLNGRYACGPMMPNGEPEFGWREFEVPPINKEAADEIAALTARAEQAERERDRLIEDRARFPDRPDDVGRMIEAHIGNLKIGKEEAERHAREHMVKASAEIKRLRAYIWSLDGKTIAIRGEGNTFIDDGIIIAADVVREPEQNERTGE
jgi:hypothetical protein